MTIHPRHFSVRKASCALELFMSKLQEEYQLTSAERIAILSEIISRDCHYLIRAERDDEEGEEE